MAGIGIDGWNGHGAVRSPPTPNANQRQLGSRGAGKTAYLRTLAAALGAALAEADGYEENVDGSLYPTNELTRVNFLKAMGPAAERFKDPLRFRVFDMWGE